MGANLADADFSGWATKAGLRCSDGRTIMPEAFKHMDGEIVPLVWQHGHDAPENVLGHALLKHMEGQGVYAYSFFNDTDPAQTAKALVEHGDIKNLSIFANQLNERNKQVFHGQIRELSLVLSGANPGAVIDNVAIRHSDDTVSVLDEEAIIYTGVEIDTAFEHADGDGGDDETVQDIFNSMSEKQKNVVYYMLAAALDEAGGSAAHDGLGLTGEELIHADDATVKDFFDSLTEQQKNIVYFIIASATDGGDAQHSDNTDSLSHQEGNIMGRNVFENNGMKDGTPALSHADKEEFLGKVMKTATAAGGGSLKDAILEHAGEYGIQDIDILFPDAKAISNTPELIARRMEWVNVVINGTKKSPLSRIKTISADITHEQARAKGYVKGNLKKEEWFKLSKRITTPTTIYKKQKLDRDDIIDIVDLDVVAFLKGEMRLMLDEEIARAILLGDGREVDDDDKVNEQNIRPIAHDDDFYTHRVVLPANTGGDSLVEAILRARPKYRGSGQPTLFCTEDLLTDLLLGRDKMGRRFYENQEILKTALRVSNIVTVDAMEDVSTDGGDLMAVLVNLVDYTVGADRGGNVTMFDDFDIDYNQFKYLIETRISGALTKFKSAQAFVRSSGSMVTPTVPGFDPATGVLTVPATAGVVYRNDDTQVAFAPGPQPALNAGQTVYVKSEPDNGYYFPHNIDTDWSFTRNL
jgi:hypothetical protein